jgi:hypothetical protein
MGNNKKAKNVTLIKKEKETTSIHPSVVPACDNQKEKCGEAIRKVGALFFIIYLADISIMCACASIITNKH